MRAVFLSLCFWFVRQCGCWWGVRISLVVVQVIASKQAVDYSPLAENPGSFYGTPCFQASAIAFLSAEMTVFVSTRR